jgi:hypothetical protein
MTRPGVDDDDQREEGALMSATSNSTADGPSEAPDRGDTFLTLDQIVCLAELAASYWRSVALAADRGDLHLLTLHCKQIASVTRDAFRLVREIAENDEAAPSPSKQKRGPRTTEERPHVEARK